MGTLSKAALRVSLLSLVGIAVISTSAFAQTSRDTNNRLNRLENELNTLSRAMFRGETPSAGSIGTGNAAATEVRLQQLETQLRELTGLVEQQSYQMRQLQAQMERMAGDVDVRLQDLSTGSNTTQQQQPPRLQQRSDFSTRDSLYPERVQPSSGSLGTISQDAIRRSPNIDSAAATYENAFAQLKRSDYNAAEVEFKKFLDTHPDHVLAPNAQYWYGETFYVRGDYERAARIFAEAYQKAPNGSKAPDNLLKLGMSLSGMGNRDDACVALLQLKKDDVNSSTPVLRRANQEISRLGCS